MIRRAILARRIFSIGCTASVTDDEMPILLMTIMMSGLGFGLILPGFPYVAQNLGAPTWVATTILGLYALGQFISTPIWGRFSDRYGRKPMLMGSIAGALVSFLILAFATNLWLLAAGRLMSGLMGGNLAVAMAYVSDITTPENRAKTMGWVGASMSIGFIVGPFLGGMLGGADATSATLLWPALAAASVCAISLIGGLFFLRESLGAGQRAKKSAGSPMGGLRGIRHVIGRPILARLVLVGFLVYLAMALFEIVFPFWTRARFGWGPREIGSIFAWLGLLVAITQGVLMGRLVAAFGESRLLIGGLSSYVLGLLIMVASPGWPVMIVGISFTTIGSALYMTTMNSLVSQQAGEHERGLVLGTYNSASWLGRTVGPLMTGILFDTVGRDASLYTSALVLLPCIAIMVGVVRRLGKWTPVVRGG